MSISRRDFLKSSALGVSVSFLAPELMAGVLGTDHVGHDRILVILQLAGGNDAVNTFIPYTDSRYRSLRPQLAIPDNQILKVDSQLGFHPSMAPLQSLYEQRKFAFINNVGFPTLDRSHFHCQDVWQTADPEGGSGGHGGGMTGWIGRFADTYLQDLSTALTSVSITSNNPLGMIGQNVLPAAVASAESFDVQTDPRYAFDREAYIAALRSTYGSPQLDAQRETIRNQGKETFGAVDLLKTIPPPSTTATYPNSALGRAFTLAAQIASGGVGTFAIWIRTGGFDTHSAQPNTHANLWADVSQALSAFDQDVNERGIGDRVMVMGWSEFGRRVQENASLGTDHGKAGTMFVSGNKVKGGTFYGDVPDLSNLDKGDLPTEIDFRAVYATIIRDWFQQDPEPVLNGVYENVGFVQTESTGLRLRNRR